MTTLDEPLHHHWRWPDRNSQRQGYSLMDAAKQLEAESNLGQIQSSENNMRQMSHRKKFIYIIDDDALIRRSAHIWLSSKYIVPRSFANAKDFLDEIPNLKPGCLLLDVIMPDLDGISMLKQYANELKYFNIIMITGHGDIQMATNAMKLGAVDFVEKPFKSQQLLESVEHAFDQLFTRLEVVRRTEQAKMHVQSLTKRETEILQALGHGRSSKVIARELDLSPRTVEMHRANVMKKLGMSSLAEAVKLALLSGIITENPAETFSE